jgi:hypothetical protein
MRIIDKIKGQAPDASISSKYQSMNGVKKKSKGGVLFSFIVYVEELIGQHKPVSKKGIHRKLKDSLTA